MVRAMSIDKPLREMVQQELRAHLGPIQKDVARLSESLESLTRIREVLERLAPLAERMAGGAQRARPRQEPLPGLFERETVRKAPSRPATARAAPARQAETRPVAPLQPPPPPPELEEYLSTPEEEEREEQEREEREREEERAAQQEERAAREAERAAQEEEEPEEELGRRAREVRQCAIIGCRRPARSKGYCSAHYQKLRLLVKTNRRPASWVDDAAPNSVPEIVLPRGRAAQREREEEVPAEPPPPAEPPKPKAWIRKKGATERISLV